MESLTSGLLSTSDEFFGSLDIFQHDSIYLLSFSSPAAIDEHKVYNLLPTQSIAATDLELRENRINIKNDDALNFSNIEEAVLAASKCIGETYRKLSERFKYLDWMIWGEHSKPNW